MTDHPIILYDGDCGFCSRIVVFVVERDRQARFRFAPLQSPFGRAILSDAGLPQDDLDSVVLFHDGRALTRSSAAIAVAAGLGGLWRLSNLLQFIPRPLRDKVYDLIARNRLRLMPARNRCVLPAEFERRLVTVEFRGDLRPDG